MAAPETTHRQDETPGAGAQGEAEPDSHIGAIEGDRPGDEQHRNANVPALDSEGLPADTVKICEDVLGANEDESQG